MPESTPILRHPPPDPRQLRNREETLPSSARSSSTPVHAPSLEELREARHLLGVTAAAGLTFGLVALVFFELLAWSLNRGQRVDVVAREDRAGECREEDPSSCPSGHVCRGGACVTSTVADLTCQDGDTCEAPGATCTCQSPMKCVDQTCEAEAGPPPVCSNLDIQELLGAISQQCKGDFMGCPDTELEKFVLPSKTFDQVLAKFPETITVHFPSGYPSVQGGSDWPTAEVSAYYREHIASPRTMKALREAKHVLLIARSSKGGSDRENLKYSRVRSQVVLSKLLEAAASQEERERLEAKFKYLALGSRKVLTATLFRKSYQNRMYAWSVDEEKLLRTQVASYQTLAWAEKNRVDNLLNQVVIIVPIPCDLPGLSGASSE